MDPIRRHLLKAAGLFVATRAFADDPPGASMQPSSVKPRHVLCFLGKNENLLQPPKAVAKTIADFGFEIDRTHSQARPDANMTRSFGVCWDRVFPKAWSALLMDEIADAMAEHGIDATLRDRKLTLSREQDYAEADFKFNPYGIVRIEA